MNKIRIITDSGSDITPKRAEELGIRLIPISFTFDGEKYYRSGIDMPLEEFTKDFPTAPLSRKQRRFPRLKWRTFLTRNLTAAMTR